MNTTHLNTELSFLTGLVHHRWNIPIIAELHRQSGAKFITLLNHLRVSRGSLSASLYYLRDLGLVRKNEGHGHPMRPEYLLTQQGLAIGSECRLLVEILRHSDETDLAFRKWTLPLVVAIGKSRLRFNEVRASLGDATPRAIASGLRSLLQYGWLDRSLIDEFPPTAGYELTARGRRILDCLENLYNAR